MPALSIGLVVPPWCAKYMLAALCGQSDVLRRMQKLGLGCSKHALID